MTGAAADGGDGDEDEDEEEEDALLFHGSTSAVASSSCSYSFALLALLRFRLGLLLLFFPTSNALGCGRKGGADDSSFEQRVDEREAEHRVVVAFRHVVQQRLHATRAR